MPNIVTQIVPEQVSEGNFIFQKTTKGPLMQFTHNGLVCLMASAETRTAQMIKAAHTDIYRKNYKKDVKGSFDTVLQLQAEWRANKEWSIENGIIYMNNLPAYRVLDNTIRITADWFRFTNQTVNRTKKVDSLNSLKEEFNTFIDSLTIKGTPEFIDWYRDQVTTVNEALEAKLAVA